MKSLLIYIALLLLASCACAEIMEFENFSLDVPEGWVAIEEGQVVTVMGYDSSARLVITTARPDDDASIEDIAAAFALELGGTAPESDDEGIYTFEFDEGRSQAAISGSENLYMLIIGTDAGEEEALGEILESLEMK